MNKLTANSIALRRRRVPDWSIVAGKLQREFRFRDFVEAFAFMTRVALLAERANHHPEWNNVWNRVTIGLVTHEARGITPKDFDLACEIDAALRPPQLTASKPR